MASPPSSYLARVLLGVVVALTITSTVSLVLRFVSKRITKTTFSAEDFLIVASLIVLYALSCVLLLCLGVIGRHTTSLPPSTISSMLKKMLAMQCLYPLCLGLTKISICVFYNRIFDRRKFHVASWSIIAVIIAWMLGAVFYALLVCRPLSYWWDPSIVGKSCGTYIHSYIITGVVDVLTDFAMIILPQPLLWKLKVPLPDKIALTCIFGTSVVTMVISVLRVIALANVSIHEITHTASYGLILTFTEPAVAISVACAPFCRPIFRRAFPKSDIQTRNAPAEDRQRRPQGGTFPSFVNPNIHFEMRRGKQSSHDTSPIIGTGCR